MAGYGQGSGGYWGGYTGPAPAAPAPAPAPAYSPPPTYSGRATSGSSYSAPSIAPTPSYSTGAYAAPGAPPSTNIGDTPYAWMLSIPDVANVLNQWQSGGLSDTWLKSHIMATPWYRTTSETLRNYTQLVNQDPATALQQREQKAYQILAYTNEMGLKIDWPTAQQLGEDAIKFGWSDTTLQFHLNTLGFGESGKLEAEFARLKAMSKDYGVPVSDEALQVWVRRVLLENQGEDAFRAVLIGSAKSLYPQLTQALDGGATVKEIFDPYAQLAAKELGISPTMVDFTDPKWNKAISTVDAKTGNKVPMTLAQWQSELRTDPVYGWDTTQGAREAATELSTKLLNKFGMVS